MTTPDEDPAADRLEQQAEVDADEIEEQPPAEEDAAASGSLEAPDADVLDQHREVPVEDDEDLTDQ